MFNLIKFEWIRRWKFFLSGIIVFLAVNIDMIISFTKQQQNLAPLTVALTVILFAFWMALVFDHMSRIYRTLFTDEGLLELTLPLNGYQFLGAKTVAVAVELGVVMLFVALVAYLDLMYINRVIPDWQLTPITGELVLKFLQLMALGLGVYITFMLMVYLSLVLAKSLFGSFKYGKIIAFGSFLLIVKITDLLMSFWHVNSNYDIHGSGFNVAFGFNIASQEWFLLILIISILFGSTGYLLDKKINL